MIILELTNHHQNMSIIANVTVAPALAMRDVNFNKVMEKVAAIVVS
jgi:hypothetical protein